MAFYTFAGKAWFDRVGLEPGAMAPMTSAAPAALEARTAAEATTASEAPAASAATTAPSDAAPKSFRARWFERLRRLGSLLARGRRRPTSGYTTYQFTPTATVEPTVETQTSTPLRRYSLYTPELNLLAETALTTAQSPAIAHEYIWFGGEPAAQVTTSTGAIAWYFNDHLGTPILRTNASADIIWRVERDPYGTPHSYRAGATRDQPLAFPGQEERIGDGELRYNIFRWYRAGGGGIRRRIRSTWRRWQAERSRDLKFQGGFPDES